MVLFIYYLALVISYETFLDLSCVQKMPSLSPPTRLVRSRTKATRITQSRASDCVNLDVLRADLLSSTP